MRRIVLSSVARPALPYFTTLFHKRHDLREKVVEHKMCVLIFSTTFVGNISHSDKNSARYYRRCRKVFHVLKQNLNIYRQIFDKY
jgi:hypothetical protein